MTRQWADCPSPRINCLLIARAVHDSDLPTVREELTADCDVTMQTHIMGDGRFFFGDHVLTYNQAYDLHAITSVLQQIKWLQADGAGDSGGEDSEQSDSESGYDRDGAG